MTRSRLRKLNRLAGRHRPAAAGVPLVAALAGTMSPAMAQQNESAVLENIIVTAQKGQEDLQDVPVSIQAMGGEKLEQLHVADFDEYVQFLPSVTFQTTNPGFSQVYMRGVASGGDGNHSGSLPSVGMYLDEQPITTIQGNLDVHMYDIERVEALAGPQGTLYGASSQAGTIRIITNKPSADKFAAGYDLEGTAVSDGDQGYLMEGFVNIPLSERAAIRLVGWNRHDPGYIDNVFAPTTYAGGSSVSNAGAEEDDYNDVDTYGARAALRVDLNDRWSITPQVMAQRQLANGVNAYDENLGKFKVGHRFPEHSDDRWAQAALTVEGKISNLDVVYAGSYLRRNVDLDQDYADYTYWYDVAYASMDPSYDFVGYFYDDLGNQVADPGQYIQAKDRYKRETHELRVSTPTDRRLRFVGGLFMQRQVHGIEQRYLIDNLAETLAVTGWEDTIWLTEQERIDRDYAVFGEVSYDLTDKLTLTGGLRWFKAENSLIGFFGLSDDYSGSGTNGETLCSDVIDPDDDSANPDDPDNDNRGNSRGDTTGWTPFQGIRTAPCTNLNQRVEEDDTIHKLSASYKFTADRMVYATWSRGFRPGGVNRFGGIPPYLSDFLTNYEIGWKTTWAGNRVRFNGAIFKQEWEDFQYSFIGANGLTIIRNANQATINGIEADVTWVITGGLTVSAGAAYIEAELDEPYCGEVLPDGRPVTDCADPPAPKGTPLPVTPDLKANASVRYEFPLGNFDAHVQGSVVYQDEVIPVLEIAEADLLGTQGSYTLVDLSTGITNGKYTLELFANNVFDELAEVSRYAECAIATCGYQTYVVPFRPRTIGLKFGQRF
jgi:iron complex outermembrane recepter protein